MRDNIYTTVRRLVSMFGQQPVWAVYQLELTPDLTRIVSKSLDVIEYHTADEDNEPFVVVMDVAEARDLLENLTTALETSGE